MEKIKTAIVDLLIKFAVFLSKKIAVESIRTQVLMPHKFKTTDLIRSKNGSGLLEVEMMMYDTDLNPVHVVTKYGGSGQYYTVSYPAILEYVEHKGAVPGSMEIS